MIEFPRTGKKLCCQINPCYICESCGFRQCLDHWSRRGSWQGHFPDRRCSTTGNKVIKPAEENEQSCYVWKEA